MPVLTNLYPGIGKNTYNHGIGQHALFTKNENCKFLHKHSDFGPINQKPNLLHFYLLLDCDK